MLATIVGIDPGTETLGLATLWFSPLDMKIASIEVETVIGSKHHYYEWVQDFHSERYNKLLGHQCYLKNHFDNALPLAIACESPFYNRLRPNAFEALTGTLNAVRQAVVAHSLWRSLDTVDPPTVKIAIGAPGNADKLAVKCAFERHEIYGLVSNPQALTEHAIDAVCVAYWRYKQLI
jgi:Holliday junction resolvasome RuvABC endonuclease subunit